MGWLLLNNGSRQRLRLKPGTVLIGRAQQAHIRPNHQSVSRGHAEILVEVPADGNLQEVRPYPIYLIDRSSSQLTFVNATPSGVGIRKPLQPGDTVTFGVDPVNFSLQWAATVLSCSSRMKPPEVTAIQGMARTAGVFLTTEWADGCTHLLMDQLAITPKLLCCIVDGGVPVAASYLQALAACDQAGQAPEPIHHQPLAPAGADATYAEELQNCARAPRPRHDLLKGVWIIYAARGTCEGLSKALTSAGARDALNAMVPGTPPTPFVCSSIQDVASVAAALTKSREQVGAPDEIWLVPGLEEEIVSALAGTLLALGARECRAVPLQAMVSGILKGDKSSVCAGASRVTLSKTSPDSYPDTAQHQALRPAQISAKVDDVKVAAAVKDETFPHTQEQPGLPPVITGKRQEQEPPAREAAAKRQKIDMPEPAVPSTGRYEASAVKFSNSQEPLPKPDVSAGMAHTVSSYGRPKSELAGIGAPLPVSSDGGLKKDADKLKVEAGGLAPVSVISSLGGPSQGHRTATQDGSGMPKILSINFDTPMTQPKPEVQENREVISEPVTKIELKAKVEAPAPAPVPQPAASASASGAVGGQIVLRTESSHVPAISGTTVGEDRVDFLIEKEEATEGLAKRAKKEPTSPGPAPGRRLSDASVALNSMRTADSSGRSGKDAASDLLSTPPAAAAMDDDASVSESDVSKVARACEETLGNCAGGSLAQPYSRGQLDPELLFRGMLRPLDSPALDGSQYNWQPSPSAENAGEKAFLMSILESRAREWLRSTRR